MVWTKFRTFSWRCSSHPAQCASSTARSWYRPLPATADPVSICQRFEDSRPPVQTLHLTLQVTALTRRIIWSPQLCRVADNHWSIRAVMILLLRLIPYGFILLTVVVIKLLFWVGFMASRLRPLSKIPGPWWARYTRFWLVKTLASGRSQHVFIDVNKEYGSVHLILSRETTNLMLARTIGSYRSQ